MKIKQILDQKTEEYFCDAIFVTFVLKPQKMYPFVNADIHFQNLYKMKITSAMFNEDVCRLKSVFDRINI